MIRLQAGDNTRPSPDRRSTPWARTVNLHLTFGTKRSLTRYSSKRTHRPTAARSVERRHGRAVAPTAHLPPPGVRRAGRHLGKALPGHRPAV